MELYKKYRPRNLGQMIGQDVAVRTLKAAIDNDSIPHFILFTGPTGCGKTTFARIIRRELKCSKYDFIEDAPRKIEDVRLIKQRIHLAPMGKGNCRVWLIDECFVSNTIIETPVGSRFIQNLQPDDSIFSAAGEDKILNVFTKKIPLYRLTKISISDGRCLFCSDGHEFYTNRGWIKAKNLLKKDLIFSFVCNIMRENLLKGNEYGNQSMQRMQGKDAKIYKGKKDTNVLQQEMCNCLSVSKNGEALSCLRQTSNSISETQEEVQQNVLQQELFGKGQTKTGILSQKTVQCQNETKNKSKTNRIFPNKGRKEGSKKKFSKNVEKQSDEQSQDYRKNEGNKKKEWNFSSVERKERRQWSIYRTTKKIMGFIGIRLANGIGHLNQAKTSLSLQLQSRCGEQRIKDRYRNRWERPSCEKEYAERCKKAEPSAVVRVENIEIYKQGSNDQSFESVIGDRELHRNYITLYDIEVEKHPSYFANGILVHNCHKLTSDAQDEFLKMLEDTPSHVYFLFTTTDPQKLKSTIKNRCTEITVKPLNEDNLIKLIKYVCREERTKISSEVIEKIVENSNGSARKALVYLNGAINLKSKSEMLNAIVTSTAETQAIAIARALFNPKTKWLAMAKILKETEMGEEAEQIRWMVLGYSKTIILSGGKLSGRAYIIISTFADNFYDSKWAGLAAACYEITEGGK